MAIEYGFLETIGGRSMLSPDMDPPASRIEAVRQNLILLLNTRRGSVAHLPLFGLPDMHEVFKAYPDSLEVLRQGIAETIALYEPRLDRVEVEAVHSAETHFLVDFSIRGTIDDDTGQARAVSFNTVISGNGRAEVS